MSSPEVGVQHVEAIATIARRLNFRPKSVQALPIDRRRRHLAQLTDVSDAVATRALIAYHFSAKRPLMAAFLDALGIAHDNGLITEDEVAAPEARASSGAAMASSPHTQPDAVSLYLGHSRAIDGDTWRNLAGGHRRRLMIERRFPVVPDLLQPV